MTTNQSVYRWTWQLLSQSTLISTTQQVSLLLFFVFFFVSLPLSFSACSMLWPHNSIPVWVGEVTAWILYWWAETHVPTQYREYYHTLWLVWINRKNWRFFPGARNWLPLRIKGKKSGSRHQIWCSIQLSLHKEPPEVGLVKKLTGSLY